MGARDNAERIEEELKAAGVANLAANDNGSSTTAATENSESVSVWPGSQNAWTRTNIYWEEKLVS